VDFHAFLKRVGANVRRARWSEGKTQTSVQAMTPRVYGELERGLGNPTLKTLFLLAQEFDVSVSDLVNIRTDARQVSLKDKPERRPKAGRKPSRTKRTNK
jgi:transcriptional regulator with XRE-family HTH domain